MIRDSQHPINSSHASRVTSHYDVIIAGASFAGLAAAQRLRGRVLLVDKDPIGEGVTSACGAPVSIVRAMGAENSIQQVHDQLVIHTERSRAVWPLPEPFCTFHYREFCRQA
ncbi:MAG: FAD-binding oxidoreductase, partial [Armatimonadetes bacterium]|nr:FAD-binding oxidoreductase [Armatimonadota bacterium]